MNDNKRCPDCNGPIVWSQYYGVPYCLWCKRRFPETVRDNAEITPREQTRRAVEDVQRAIADKPWSEAGKR